MNPSAPAPAKAPAKTSPRARLLRIIFAALLVVMAIGIALYWHHRKYHPVTEDAYVDAPVVSMASQVSAPLQELPVKSYQKVSKGQLLMVLDPAMYEVAVARAEAAVEKAGQGVSGDRAGISAAQANVRAQQATLDNAERQYNRAAALAKTGVGSKAALDDATAMVKEARAGRDAAQQEVERVVAQLGGQGKANADIRLAQAELKQARLNLSYTRITSPVDGQVGYISARPGSYVTAGQPLFPLVDSENLWVDANFKETELQFIKPGQVAEVISDIFAKRHLKGRVLKISPASGQAFSLLPSENATGNWVKVTQRFPVRIALEAGQDFSGIQKGASATVVVDTTSTPDKQ